MVNFMYNFMYSTSIILLTIIVVYLSVQVSWAKKLIELLIEHSNISDTELTEYVEKFI